MLYRLYPRKNKTFSLQKVLKLGYKKKSFTDHLEDLVSTANFEKDTTQKKEKEYKNLKERPIYPMNRILNDFTTSQSV